jgi:predicted nucleic acid-binding protein
VTPSFLLDTDVLSNLRRRRPHPSLANWLASIDPDALFTSVMTITEIQCGIALVQDTAQGSLVQSWFDAMLRDGRPTIVDLNVGAAVLLGQMWATPALRVFIASDPRSSKIKNGSDLAIAAAAIDGGMILVSGNVTDFLQIHAAFPLPGLFDPFTLSWRVRP